VRRWLWSLGVFMLSACAAAAPAPKPASEQPVTGDAVEPEAAQAPVEAESEDPPAPAPQAAALPDLGPAPELENEVWLNVDAPLRLADLRGKVVLLDMWTFGCVNCQHVIPSLREWHYEYGPLGLVVIGNHYPEFDYERSLDNLKDALVRLDVPYAVAQDNDRATWAAYNNRYWPTLYLIDKRGHLRYSHIGEGHYAETEAAIVALLAEPYP
jgi:thiol-disulfide isomerase/thioredoxin